MGERCKQIKCETTVDKLNWIWLAVACWTTDRYHPGSNLGVGISEGRFIFDFITVRGSSAHLAYHVH
jgi:hypothetical protein